MRTARTTRLARGALIAFAGLAASLTGALAQGLDCGRLAAQIASLGSGGGRGGQYEQAASRQRVEYDRTLAYARSLGCGNRQFLFFGSAPSPQCPALEARMQSMRANLDQLQNSAERLGGGAQRRALQLRFDAYCRGGGQAAAPQQRGFFESLFGGPRYQQVPVDPYPEEAVEPQEPREPAGPGPGSRAVCVRTCDGGFFPVSYSATRGKLDDLEDLCKALCPGVEARLYTYQPSADIDQAVSVEGEPYSSLPAALKYRTTYDPTCACKPPNKSWVQALAEAEAMISQAKSDILVTPEKAEELSRPETGLRAGIRAPAVKKPPVKTAKPDEDATAIEGATGAAAPTAGDASAGITPGRLQNGQSYSRAQGEMREVEGPNGTRRRVRVIAPTL